MLQANKNAALPADAMTPSPQDQWLDAPIRLRPELKFDVRKEGGKSFVVVEDPVRGKFFQVGTLEYQLVAILRQYSSPRESLQQFNELNPTNQYDDASAAKVVQWLIQNNLATSSGFDNAKRLNQLAANQKKAKLIGLINPISFKFRLFNPERMLTAIQPYSQWVFSFWFLLIWMVVGVWAVRVIYTDWDRMGAASTGVLSGYSWIWLMITWFVLKVVHEAAHGIACKRYGGEVPEAGVLLLLFTPMAYVNVTSMWRFSNRWHRMVVAGAGMYVELFLSFLAVIYWSSTEGVAASIAFNIFLMASVTTILFNANPLMRFDGYFLLADALGITNLYTKGTKWFGDRCKSLFFGVPKTPGLYGEGEFTRIAVYGFLAFFWKISISVSLIIGAGVLFQGAGLLMSAIGVAMFFGIPIYKQVTSLFGAKAVHKVRPWRLATSLLTLLAVGLSLFSFLKAPANKSAPAIVQFAEETLLRAGADGFVSELLVKDGDQVTRGQVLVTLRNPQLANEVEELRRLANESKIQSRIHANNDELSLAAAEQKKHEELLEQLCEKSEQAAGLKIVAPFDGFVFRRNLNHQLGNFVSRGDPVLTIAQQDTKEIVVSVDQRDFESMKQNLGKDLRVLFPGVKLLSAKLEHVDPGATQSIKHPSLCANAGGVLDVRPVASEAQGEASQFELLAPRFNIVLAMDTKSSENLKSGQRGRAFFSTCEQSLGSYFYIAASDWLKAKIELSMQTAVF